MVATEARPSSVLVLCPPYGSEESPREIAAAAAAAASCCSGLADIGESGFEQREEITDFK